LPFSKEGLNITPQYTSDVCLIQKCHLSQNNLRANDAGTSDVIGYMAEMFSNMYTHGSPKDWLAGPRAPHSAHAKIKLGKWAQQPGSCP